MLIIAHICGLWVLKPEVWSIYYLGLSKLILLNVPFTPSNVSNMQWLNGLPKNHKNIQLIQRESDSSLIWTHDAVKLLLSLNAAWTALWSCYLGERTLLCQSALVGLSKQLFEGVSHGCVGPLVWWQLLQPGKATWKWQNFSVHSFKSSADYRKKQTGIWCNPSI